MKNVQKVNALNTVKFISRTIYEILDSEKKSPVHFFQPRSKIRQTNIYTYMTGHELSYNMF